MVIKRTWMPLVFCWLMHESRALAQTLPRGIGVINLGTRNIWADAGYYDQFGQLKSLGSRLDVEFDAASMRTGKAGASLKKLYDNIAKYDTNSGTGQGSIGDELNLGSQRGIVKPTVSVNIVGIGFGISNKVTAFAGVPFISAKNETDIEFSGTNNAAEIKAKLGDAAFDELKAGLDQASQLSKDTVLSEITEKNRYRDIRHWTYKGPGDAVVGIRTGKSATLRGGQKYALGIQAQVTLPTGPAYDPDSLTQIPLSQNTTSFGLVTDHRITWTYFAAGGEVGADYPLPYDRKQRVPEGSESVIPIERKTIVHVQPGMALKGSLYSLLGNATYRSQYRLGINQKQATQFRGSLAGDYGALGRPTFSNEVFHELELILTTVKIYKQRKFVAPFILTLKGHDSLSGKNENRQKYIELTLILLFSTPMASG